MKKKRFFPIYLLAALFLCLTAAFCFCNADTILFRHLTKQFFTQSLENDVLTLHYTLADPEAFGVKLQSAALPVYSAEGQKEALESSRRFLEKLSGIDPEKLSEEDSYTHALLSAWLSEEIAGAAFPWYDEPLSPASGMHTELPLLLAEYTFRDAGDVRDYLSLLASVPAYLESLTAYESEKADAGLFMAKEDALLAADQCGEILDEGLLADGNHFLQTTFSARLDALLEAGAVTQQEKIQFLAENDRLLTEAVAPAYQKLSYALTALSGKSTDPGGLCRLPDGKEYYAWLVRRATGCSMDPDALQQLLQKQFQKTYRNLQTLITAYRELTGNSPDYAALTEDFSLTDPAGILADLRQRMAADFPDVTALTDQEIGCTIKDVDSALEPFTSPAYYMTPPVDDLWHNTICINRSSTAEGVELYTTLAHEGYPGHLYQTVYSALAAESADSIPVRELLYYGGYTEGWAYYVEQLSYQYAAQVLAGEAAGSADTGAAGEAASSSGGISTTDAAGSAAAQSATPSKAAKSAALLCEIAAVQRDLQVNLFCILDISLHYQGASEENILQTLTALGIGDAAAERIYDYLRTAPATYLKYYVGYLEMLALRARAQQLWGDEFTLLRFHTFVLEAGPSDFSSLIQRLESQ